MRPTKRRFAGRFLDFFGDSKRLLRSFGLLNGGSDKFAYAFFADYLNSYFTTPDTGSEFFSCLSLVPLQFYILTCLEDFQRRPSSKS
jgi:hypothetical protein